MKLLRTPSVAALKLKSLAFAAVNQLQLRHLRRATVAEHSPSATQTRLLAIMSTSGERNGGSAIRLLGAEHLPHSKDSQIAQARIRLLAERTLPAARVTLLGSRTQFRMSSQSSCHIRSTRLVHVSAVIL